MLWNLLIEINDPLHHFQWLLPEYLHRMIGPFREELKTFNIDSVVYLAMKLNMARLMGDGNNKDDIITIEPERFKGLIKSFLMV